MAGIYIHIPFCKQHCHYCNFHFTTSLRYKTELLNAILTEIEFQKEYLQDEKIETIYFGGGTPSLLNIDELRLLIEKIQMRFSIVDNAEITLEANPDDITIEQLSGWKAIGINRLSIGIQSFFEEDLKWMNRAHTARQAIEGLQTALLHFDNITIDLIYGTPNLTNENWKQNVEMAVSLHIPHLSCYALTVEPKTPLDKLIKKNQSEMVNPEKQSDQFLLLMNWMEKSGYEHYEISNFAKTGFRSRHNSSYWQGKKYLGFGPSAHSFNGKKRQWNIANNNVYISSLSKGVLSFEKEELSTVQQLNEYLMTSLRTIEGISIDEVKIKFGINREMLLKKSNRFIENGLLIIKNNQLLLTRNGKLLADGITAALFF